jgi:hypothetical protein
MGDAQHPSGLYFAWFLLFIRFETQELVGSIMCDVTNAGLAMEERKYCRPNNTPICCWGCRDSELCSM